jgi:hypothetical protein
VITPHFVQVPCRCGGAHRLPVPPTGEIAWACGTARKVFRLTLAKPAMAKLLAGTPTQPGLDGEKACIVHKAEAPADGRQVCEDCGFPLLSYRALLRACPSASVAWWPTGALVGVTSTFDAYRVILPLTPGRERRCFVPEAM